MFFVEEENIPQRSHPAIRALDEAVSAMPANSFIEDISCDASSASPRTAALS